MKGQPVVFSLLLIACTVRADTIRLRSGESLEGRLEGAEEKTIQFSVGGKTQQIPRSSVISIDLGSPRSGDAAVPENPTFLAPLSKDFSPFSTPTTTFLTWKKAAMTGDVSAMVKCYASFKQDEKKKELKKLPKDAFEKMRAATLQTDFAASPPVYQGDRATMVVNWTKGLDGNEQVLQFLLEKNDWKILQ